MDAKKIENNDVKLDVFPKQIQPIDIIDTLEWGSRWDTASGNDYARFASNREIKPVRHLVKNWVPVGCLSVITGPPGAGKSMIVGEIAASVTQGFAQRNIEPRNVLILNAEDDFDSVIVPRLYAAGANLSRVINGRGFKFNLHEDGVLPKYNSNDLEDRIIHFTKHFGKIDLVIFDPLSQVIDGDFTNNSKARPVYEGLSNLAKKYDFAALGLSHTVKNLKGKSMLDRMAGPSAIVQVCRHIMLTVKNEKQANDGGTHSLLVAKDSYQKTGGGSSYSIMQYNFKYGENIVATSKIKWHDDLQGEPEELFRRAEGTHKEDAFDAVSKAENFLKNALQNGAAVAKSELIRLGELEQITEASLTRAKKRLQVVSEKQKGAGQAAGWLWRLPDPDEMKEPDSPLNDEEIVLIRLLPLF